MKKINILLELTFFLIFLVSCGERKNLAVPPSLSSSPSIVQPQSSISASTIKKNLKLASSQNGTLAIIDSGCMVIRKADIGIVYGLMVSKKQRCFIQDGKS